MLGILIAVNGLGQVAGQNPPIFYLDSIQTFVELDSCWVYHQGDSMIWAESGYDDSHWINFNPKINVVSSNPEDFLGKAWFRLHLSLDSSLLDQNIIFRIEQMGASEIYINGVLIQRLGKMGNDTLEEEALNPKLVPIRYHTSKKPDHVIAVRYHNSDPRNRLKLFVSNGAGFEMNVTRTDRAFLSLMWTAKYRSLYTFLVSVLYVLGILHLLLFLFYKKNKSNLLYSLFCVLLSFLVMPLLVTSSPVISPKLSAVVGFAQTFVQPAFLLTFVGLTYSFFRKKASKFFWLLAGIAFFAVLSLIFDWYSVVILYPAMYILSAVEVIRILILASRQKKVGVRILGMGIAFFLLLGISFGVLAIAMIGKEFSQESYQVMIATLLIVFGILSIPVSMSVFLAKDFANTNRNLSRQLIEVKRLSAISLRQEEEKREILSEQKRNLEILVKNRTKELEKEKDLTEKLLHNTLPSKVANELKATGKAKPENFENVTVFFSDIIDFTRKSIGLEPSILIEELNDLFTVFDDIMISHHCERIKTIGDAYLAVCGMPEPDVDHAENMAKASLDIIDYLKERNRNSDVKWEIRAGIHTGKLVGGIVGTRKYIYDIFGDSINTAARMEQNSEAMKINVSEITYQLLKDDYVFEKRLPKDIKGKGLMNMYFLIKPNKLHPKY